MALAHVDRVAGFHTMHQAAAVAMAAMTVEAEAATEEAEVTVAPSGDTIVMVAETEATIVTVTIPVGDSEEAGIDMETIDTPAVGMIDMIDIPRKVTEVATVAAMMIVEDTEAATMMTEEATAASQLDLEARAMVPASTIVEIRDIEHSILSLVEVDSQSPFSCSNSN